MKKVAIFLGGYLPAKKYGGPVTSIVNLVDNLGDDYAFYIISNDHDLDETRRLDGIRDGWNLVGKAQVRYLPERDYGYNRFRLILQEINADLVYLSSIFYYSMNIPAILAADSLGIPIVWAARGELNAKALRIKAWKKTPYLYLLKKTGLTKNIVFHATSDEERYNIIVKLGVLASRVFTIPNFPSAAHHKQLIEKKQGELRLLIICRLVPNKNILYAINLVKQCGNEISLDIYGPIEDKDYWKQCEVAMLSTPANVAITYKGALTPQEAQDIYLNYDCLLFPTEFENYGQVIAEALSHDCPVIISKGTTPWDDVTIQNAGYAVKIGKDDEFVTAINEMANFDTQSFENMVECVRKYLDTKLDRSSLRHRYVEMLTTSEEMRKKKDGRKVGR